MVFRDEQHEDRYFAIIAKMKSNDVYHAALAYLLALDSNVDSKRLAECFDFSEDIIKPGVLEAAWITSTDRRVLKLGFNLWNDTHQANVSDVFCAGADLEYLLEAVKIRFN